MRHLPFVLCLLPLPALAGDPQPGEAALAQIAGGWTVVTVEATEPEAPADFTITSDRISGQSGCNRFFATLSVTGAALEIGPLALTKMACPAPQMRTEMAVTAALSAADGFALTPEGDLVLMAETRAVLTAARAVSPPQSP